MRSRHLLPLGLVIMAPFAILLSLPLAGSVTAPDEGGVAESAAPASQTQADARGKS